MRLQPLRLEGLLWRRAASGDEAAFRELADAFRGELQAHCYRIMGSVQDAEDLVQETLLAAWRGLDGFEGRASLRSWLYRIATNRCLNALRDRGRRLPELPPPPAEAPAPPEPTRRGEPIWPELSKAGSRTLRFAAVEAAQGAWRETNPWHRLYSDVKARTGKANPAKSAVARKVVIACWHVLSREEPFKPHRPRTDPVPASSLCFLAA
jgi:DNA-directed RNA polymerase specialized sigma24 family protein